MVTKDLIELSHIEEELDQVWESLESVEKTKAALFNLVVHVQDLEHVNYVRETTRRILTKFPSRVIFLLENPDAKQDYLHTQVSVEPIAAEEFLITCDAIQIEFASKNRERVPFIVLPHLLPDLPVHLLTVGDPGGDFFSLLQPYATRVIYDPDTLEAMPDYCRLLEQTNQPLSDLKWSAIAGWRQILTDAFNDQGRLSKLYDCRSLVITYASGESPFRCDPRLKGAYLQAWIASRLGWMFEKVESFEETTRVSYQGHEVLLREETTDLPLGTVTAVELLSHDGSSYKFLADRAAEVVKIKGATPERCDLPYSSYLPSPGADLPLSREIFRKGTSDHHRGAIRMLCEGSWS